MSYAVLRAVMQRATREGTSHPWFSRIASDDLRYLHAVAARDDIELNEYQEALVERPPMQACCSIDQPVARHGAE